MLGSNGLAMSELEPEKAVRLGKNSTSQSEEVSPSNISRPGNKG